MVFWSGNVVGYLAHSDLGPQSLLNTAPSIVLDFVNGGATGDPRLTTTRAAGGATYFDSTGTLQMAAANTQRIDYGYTGGATPIGLLIEEARVNSIRNPRCEGAIAGAPGTMPTDWGAFGGPGLSGLTVSVVDIGAENGVPFIDISVVGTPSATSQCFSAFDNAVTIAASSNWTQSVYLRLIAGSLANVNGLGFQLNENPLVIHTDFATPTGAALASQRLVLSFTAGASATSVQPFFVFSVTNGLAVNFTIRIGCPQLELGACVTSPILPAIGTPAVTSRAGDVVVYSGTFQQPLSMVYIGLCVNAGAVVGGLDDGTGFNGATYLNYTATSQVSFTTLIGGVGQAGLSSTNINVGGVNKFGFSMSNAARSFVANGAALVSAAETTPLPTYTLFVAAGAPWSPGAYDGWVKSVRYWSRALSNAELLAATT